MFGEFFEPYGVDINDLAFFYLPISEEVRQKTLSLLSLLNQRWKEKTSKIPLRTVLQKLAVEFVENQENLRKEIPILRFHYGQTLAMRHEDGIEYGKLELTKEQGEYLDRLIGIYKNFSSKDAKDRQYKKDFMKFYSKKEKMWTALTKKEYKGAEEGLLDMGVYYYPDLLKSFNLFDRLIYCAVNILNTKKNNEELLSRLREVYSLVWDCLTTEAYFNDISTYIEKGKEELFSQIKSNYLTAKVANVRNILDELESDVNSLELEDIDGSDNVSEFVHELFSS